jgi:hypothetical protein
MPKGWAASTRSVRWLTAGIVAFVLGLAVIWVLFVPAADWLAHHDVGSVRGSLHETAVDNARGRLLTLGAGLFAAGALIFTARNFTLSRRTFELTQQGQVTDRYTKAIEQLGSDKLDVRIGGIYALERVARDSARDHPTVMEVLTAFVRDHSREPWAPEEGPVPGPPTLEKLTRPDVQAAVTVIGRRNARNDHQPVNLRGANLTGTYLAGANLAGSFLGETNLTLVTLTGADLTGADLTDANLLDANLTGADLTRAILTRANLGGATLTSTHLTSVNLTGVDFAGVDFVGTTPNLTGAFVDSDAVIPVGWQRDTRSGQLKRSDTNSGGTTAS